MKDFTLKATCNEYESNMQRIFLKHDCGTLRKGTMYIIGTLGAKKSVFFGSGRRFRMPPTLTGRSRRTGLASVTLPKSRPTYALRLV